MCQGDQRRRITLLCLLTHQLFVFHDSLSMDRRKPAHFTNMKFSYTSPSSKGIDSIMIPLQLLPLFSFLYSSFFCLKGCCWNLHALWVRPWIPVTRHFLPPAPITSHFWFRPAQIRKPPLKLQTLTLKIVREYFNWKLESFSHVRNCRGKGSNPAPGMNEFHNKGFKRSWHSPT